MRTLGLLFAALTAGPAACTKVDTFNCLQSSECANNGVAGVCEPGNLCSFPAADCPSGKAYGEYAGDQANRCVGDGPATTSLSATGSETNPTSTTPTTDPSATTGPPCAQACALDCADIVLDAQVVGERTVCRGHAPQAVMGCNDGGQCSVGDPVGAGCSPEAPVIIAQCDTVCVEDASLCVPNAVGVALTDFCHLGVESPGCKTACTMDGLASDAARCDDLGACQHTITACGDFTCDAATGLCRTKCKDDVDCINGKKCQGVKCI